MPHQENHIQSMLIGLAIVAVIGLVIVAGLRSSAPTTINTSPSTNQDTLSVTGTYQTDVAPDQAVLDLQVSARAPTAAQATSQSRTTLQAVINALHAQGVTDDQIETSGLTLQRITVYNYTTQTQQDAGYEQDTTLSVTVNDLTKVGAILDAATGAGVNSVQGITYQLTPASDTQQKELALAQAATIAHSKATTLASASGASLGKITSVSEQSYITPISYSTGAMALDARAAIAPTPVNPQKVTVQATVSLSYEIS